MFLSFLVAVNPSDVHVLSQGFPGDIGPPGHNGPAGLKVGGEALDPFYLKKKRQILTFSAFSKGRARSEGFSRSIRNTWTSGEGHILKAKKNKETKSVF